MQAKLIFASLAVAASASQVQHLLPRQTDLSGVSSECVDDLQELATSAPQPPAALITGLSDSDLQSNVCSFTPPASVSSEWHSYTDELKSWISDNGDLFTKIKSDCPQASTVPDLSDCSSSKSDSSSSDSNSDSNSKSDDDENAGARQNIAMGAIIAAGLLFVAAL